MYYFVKTPLYIKKIFRSFTWDVPTDKKVIYLTFDDGPTPEITNWVLEELQKHNAKATFFCVGSNVVSHPEIIKDIIEEGHSIGNHTQNHLNGWKTKTSVYLQDVLKANQNLENVTNKLLFRPPYGKIKKVKPRDYKKKDIK